MKMNPEQGHLNIKNKMSARSQQEMTDTQKGLTEENLIWTIYRGVREIPGQSGTGRQGGRGEEIPLTFLSSMPFPLPTVPRIDKTRLTAKEERSLGDLVHRGQRWVDRAGPE